MKKKKRRTTQASPERGTRVFLTGAATHAPPCRQKNTPGGAGEPYLGCAYAHRLQLDEPQFSDGAGALPGRSSAQAHGCPTAARAPPSHAYPTPSRCAAAYTAAYRPEEEFLGGEAALMVSRWEFGNASQAACASHGRRDTQ